MEAAVAKLSISVFPGPDRVTAEILKNGSDFIIGALTDLYKRSLDEETIPKQWILAFVSRIHKGGNKTLVALYRPMALTSYLCKILECVLHPIILNFMEQRGKNEMRYMVQERGDPC